MTWLKLLLKCYFIKSVCCVFLLYSRFFVLQSHRSKHHLKPHSTELWNWEQVSEKSEMLSLHSLIRRWSCWVSESIASREQLPFTRVASAVTPFSLSTELQKEHSHSKSKRALKSQRVFQMNKWDWPFLMFIIPYNVNQDRHFQVQFLQLACCFQWLQKRFWKVVGGVFCTFPLKAD